MNDPVALGIYRHRVRAFGAPFLIVLQRSLVKASTRICAPVIALADQQTILIPRVEVEGIDHGVMMLNMTAVPREALTSLVIVGGSQLEDEIAAGLDAIFKGYPVGLR